MNTISFNEDELTPEGTGHDKSLHIAAECKGMIISGVLIDNGSALNVCPMLTLSRLGVDDSLIQPNDMMVRAFDGTKTSTYGEIDLKVLVGPCEFEIPFVVIDIPAVFSLLLGRPWIHTTGSIPSSLHQRVKFISNNKLITVIAEEDIPVPVAAMVPSLTPDKWIQVQCTILLSSCQ